MKKHIARILTVGMAAALIFSAFACNKTTGAVTLKFWYFGTDAEKAMYREMVDTFNATKGKELHIEVQPISKPTDSYNSAIEKASGTRSGPDVFFVSDRYYKQWATMGFLTDLNGYLAQNDFDLSNVWPKTVEVLRYDVTEKTSDADDPLYGLPIDTVPSGIFYNEDAFAAVGVTVISVDETDLAAWNNGEIKDRAGKYKSDYALTQTIPAKGFYRSVSPYQANGAWVKPIANETLVFNNRIPMNWDELEDLAALTTYAYNRDSITKYGYYSTYWFNYGWAVGGDCIEALNAAGTGDWTFTLADGLPNYVVQADDGYTGAYSGRRYRSGEALDFKDKLDITQTDTLTADDKGGFYKNGDPSQKVKIRAAVLTDASSGTLAEMPSTKQAFTRFANLRQTKQNGGIAVCPFTTEFPSPNTALGIDYFIAGNLAMVLEHANSVSRVGTDAAFHWNVAPLPVYKTYTDSSDPHCDTVSVRGENAGHFGIYSLAIRKNSTEKEGAYRFIEWMCGSEGQAFRADKGFIPNSKALAENSAAFKTQAQNIEIFLEEMDFLEMGDWAYLANRLWIDTWANDVNSKIQQGKMTVDQYFASDVVKNTNKVLQNYG